MIMKHTLEIRVGYPDIDGMGVVHHARYLEYFERGRIELLRTNGLSYKVVEDQGYLLPVLKIEVNYRKPACYDDVLHLETTVLKAGHYKSEHSYELTRDGEVLVTAKATIVCMTREGEIHPMAASLKDE